MLWLIATNQSKNADDNPFNQIAQNYMYWWLQIPVDGVIAQFNVTVAWKDQGIPWSVHKSLNPEPVLIVIVYVDPAWILSTPNEVSARHVSHTPQFSSWLPVHCVINVPSLFNTLNISVFVFAKSISS